MLSLVNSIFKTYLGRYRRELHEHYEYPLELQSRVLQEILRTNRNTAFGKEHHFDHLLRQPDQFGSRVPVRSYDLHKPYIDRILAGEERVLTHDPPAWIATTSGTTGSVKYLPIPQRAVAEIHLRGSWLSLAALYEKDEQLQVFSHKNLLIGGAFKGIHEGLQIPKADISAVIIQSIPRIMRPFYIPDVELATAVNYEEKIEKIAQLAAHEPGITILGGVPTWNLPLYRRILEIHGGDHMLDVWPQASVFKHGGVNFAPYRAQFERLFPKPGFLFQEIYNATEGFFAIQDKDALRTMLLLLSNGIYYEFVPWEAYQRDDYSAVPLAGVRAGVPYVMLITTVAGLYRYPMGDLIEFTETDPYRLVILGRTQEFINAFGEDLLRSEAEHALMEAANRTGALVRDFTVAPQYIEVGRQGRHHWLIEFDRAPADLEVFNRELDVALQAQNNNYAAKRGNDFAIVRHELTVLPRGFFHEWMRERGKLGGQHKVPRLANHRNFLEEMLARL
ncbi:GH3 auxin-responsive promoter family protein [Lewinella sp. JB7]|uniref:GH3 auxin-responsive promoter family protein n=1 Tax=Lewinella sp. JB7 TaxID=2962887 RepID=UPI0020C9D73F|nr:GH3 auxin-responsive promoter family protein [Lewinella sp. JB7]MCP9237592.1 GH3 auxin-responsive promoter family protein [Lewinella sp. JB7]